MQMYYVNVTSLNTTSEGRIKTLTPIPFEPCTSENFGMQENVEEFYAKGMQQFLCVPKDFDNDGVALAGDYYTKAFYYF